MSPVPEIAAVVGFRSGARPTLQESPPYGADSGTAGFTTS